MDWQEERSAQSHRPISNRARQVEVHVEFNRKRGEDHHKHGNRVCDHNHYVFTCLQLCREEFLTVQRRADWFKQHGKLVVC